MSVKEQIKVNIKWKLEKFNAKNSEEIKEKNLKPYEVKECEKDVLLHEGITAMFYMIAGIGSAATKWDNTNARIGVGNDATAPADTQSGLIGASKLHKAMNATYPQKSGDHDLVFQSDFIDTEAEFAWNEETIVNASDDTGQNLCRQNTALGTKPGGQTWRLTGTVTFT
jgi:hypothetical protein